MTGHKLLRLTGSSIPKLYQEPPTHDWILQGRGLPHIQKQLSPCLDNSIREFFLNRVELFCIFIARTLLVLLLC